MDLYKSLSQASRGMHRTPRVMRPRGSANRRFVGPSGSRGMHRVPRGMKPRNG